MNSEKGLPPIGQAVLITGASGGLGADFARICARRNHPLALAARNGPALEALVRELGSPGGRPPVVVAIDLMDEGAPERLVELLTQAAFSPEILINNAGYGLNGPVQTLDRTDQVGIIDLNIRALTNLTLLCLPQISRARGRILNVASTAAFIPGPGMATYYASKAYVLSFSEALFEELRAQGVSVSVLCPGPTATGFFDRAGGNTGNLKKFSMMKSADVAIAGYRGMMAGRRVIVPGFFNKLVTTLMPLLPRALLLPVLARIQLGKRDYP